MNDLSVTGEGAERPERVLLLALPLAWHATFRSTKATLWLPDTTPSPMHRFGLQSRLQAMTFDLAWLLA